eukprot:scaffold7641_cov115-Cylindrotheca_fusiformis.AAC.29
MKTVDFPIPYEIPEPTPIAVNRMTVVEHIRVQDTQSVIETCSPCLLSFLRSEDQAIHLERIPLPTSPLQVRSDIFSQPPQFDDVHTPRNRDNTTTSHCEKWKNKFRDLVQFRRKYGHCLVPLNWPQNPGLSHWIKHQRFQYKAKQEGKHTTLSVARQQALDELGFVWDSHRAAWEERFNEMVLFREMHGHINIPIRHNGNTKLSTWVKCQRRQYKLYMQNCKSQMTAERITKLSGIGFVWCPKRPMESKSSL